MLKVVRNFGIPDVVMQYLKDQPKKTALDIVEDLYDIKIIRRYDERTPEQIGDDVFVQIYFNQYTKVRDSFTRNLNLTERDIQKMSTSEIVSVFKYDSLKQVFFAWMDRESLCKYLNELPMSDRLFSFGKRQFWRCPLKIAKKPEELPNYLSITK